MNLCWMPLTAQRLLADLWADRRALAAAAAYLSDADRALLHRERGAPWTTADVPLLDEAAELLGEDDEAGRAEEQRAAAQRAQDVRYARETLQRSGAGGGLVSAEMLAERFGAGDDGLTLAERAAADRTWAFGHVVVDEAQELSPMTWRVLLRRCPSRSMTLVGDVAQTAGLAGTTSWSRLLDRLVPGRWRLAELTVNYRTPAEIMTVAAGVLSAAGVPVRAPRSPRHGASPVAVPVRASTPEAVAEVVRAELPSLAGGRLAVVTPREGYAGLRAELAGLLPAGVVGAGVAASTALEAAVTVLDVQQAKGLEFDVVVLLEPAAVLEGSPRGASDLYVALTRPTQRLVVVHARPLPAGMTGLERAAA